MSALDDNFIFDDQRNHMIESQLQTNKIYDKKILGAFQTIPREVFVAQNCKHHAYIDAQIPFANHRVMMEPLCLAKLLNAAKPRAEDVALVIGCTTGYAIAILSTMVTTVFGVEEDAEFVKAAKGNLSALEIINCEIIKNKMANGYESQKPYQLILIEGAVEDVPAKIANQLDEGGRLVTFFKENDFLVKGRLYIKRGEAMIEKDLFESNIPVLEGFEKKSNFVL